LTEPNDIPERVTRLEREVAAARSDSAAARVLAGAADRDVSEMHAELRAHTRTLQALRTTQVEQGQEMREMRGDITEMRQDLAVLGQGQARITDLLTRHLGESNES
jgi:hypothetical protein